MRARDLARRVWRRSRNDMHYNTYKTKRNAAQNLIRSAKSAHYLEAFSNARGAASIWSKLRHLGLVKSKANTLKLACTVDELNKFFTAMPDGPTDDYFSGGSASDCELHCSPVSNFDDSKLYWSYVSASAIWRALHKAGSNATGNDGMSPALIKTALPCILPVLEHLFNFSLMHGIFPESWKTAIVCPIPKIKNPKKMQDYRPISILPALSKALERVACEQMCRYLTDRDLLNPCQFAYRGHHSTQTCLIRMLDEVRQAADNRMVTISVFFDISKAFDRVQHFTLISKLRSFDFSQGVLDWIYTYLTERSQVVRDNASGQMSSRMTTRMGIPQGSVLGPLLFSLYLTDLGGALRYCQYNIYADDVQIYYHCKPVDLEEGIRRVNDDVDAILEWAVSNKLLLNAGKTQSIIMGTSRYINAIDLAATPRITVADASIEYATHIKYLGVWISNNLSWDRQVSNTTGKVRSTLYRLKLCAHLLPDALKKRLVESLVFPHIDYCVAALTNITAELDLKLYRAVNACIRFIFRIRADVSITPYYAGLRWLKIGGRRDYHALCLLFGILRHQQPKLIYDQLKYRTATTSRAAMTADDLLLVPHSRTEFYKRSFRLSAARLWNNLPNRLRVLVTGGKFKHELNEYLLGIPPGLNQL
ncbi:reverse transcriptase [Lasius niger]|uniref:Reverse transcriptase n=1 Tax=Lasius niger TaxID=67767 RepID=A0A0J7KSZ7_LASNI|nr:reverse transcriptase [Lasius niger]